MHRSVIAAAPALWLAFGHDDHGGASELAERRVADAPGRASVLIVEDEGLVALDLERIVSEAGYQVMAVVDTERDAVSEAERLRPDVILMDIRLRQGDGVSAARTIQARRDAPVIFISANLDAATLARIGELRRAAVLRKPFSDRELLKELRNVLGS